MIIHKYNKLNTYQGSHFYGGLLERKKKKITYKVIHRKQTVRNTVGPGLPVP